MPVSLFSPLSPSRRPHGPVCCLCGSVPLPLPPLPPFILLSPLPPFLPPWLLLVCSGASPPLPSPYSSSSPSSSLPLPHPPPASRRSTSCSSSTTTPSNSPTMRIRSPRRQIGLPRCRNGAVTSNRIATTSNHTATVSRRPLSLFLMYRPPSSRSSDEHPTDMVHRRERSRPPASKTWMSTSMCWIPSPLGNLCRCHLDLEAWKGGENGWTINLEEG